MDWCYYTWSNNHEDSPRIFSRIDRVFMNHEWSLRQPEALILTEGMSDHCPIVIKWNNQRMQRRKDFQYFNMWLCKTSIFAYC